MGFVFTYDDPFVGIDLDKCRDAETGKTEDWAQKVIDDLNSYTEISPSGTGYHIIVKGKMPEDGANRKGRLEVYEKGRYFTVTGDHVEGTPEAINERQEALNAVCPRQPLRKKATQSSGDDLASLTANLESRLDENAVATAKLQVLMENSPDVKRTWQHTRKEVAWSASEWDLSLASLLGGVGR